MTNYLPWIALAVSIIAIFARDGISGSGPVKKMVAPTGAFLILLLVVAGAMVAAWKWPNWMEGLFPTVCGFAIGALLAALSYGLGLLQSQTAAGRTAPIALAATAVAFTGYFPDRSLLALVFGAASGAWLLSVGKREDANPWAMRSAIFAGCIVAVNRLLVGPGFSPEAASAGTILAIAGALSGIIGGAVGGAMSKGKTETVLGLIPAVVSFALFATASYFVTKKLELPQFTPFIFAGGGLLALVVSWLSPNTEGVSTVRTVLASVLWVAAGTAAFGMEKGLGMAVGLFAAAGILLIIGNRAALLSLGPLAALVIYRLFREAHGDASRSFDIGQHYAMIGVLLGAILPVMAQEWLRGTAQKGGGATLMAAGIWILLLAAAPIPIAVGLSVKGIVGYLVGLGLASVLEGARGEKSAHSLSLALGLGFAMVLLYDWLSPHLDLARSDKIIALAWILGVGVVAAFLIALLSSEFGKRTTPVGAEL
jgi:hypothetical protein